MKTKFNVKSLIYAIISVILMIIIYMFSSQNGNSSSELSSSFSSIVYSSIEFFANYLNLNINNISSVGFHTFIRKLAHFSIFLALGFSYYGFFSSLKSTKRIAVYLALTASLVYAISDEFHQLFVPSRGPSVTDVCIDFAGSIVGVFICYIFYRLISHLRVKHYKG